MRRKVKRFSTCLLAFALTLALMGNSQLSVLAETTEAATVTETASETPTPSSEVAEENVEEISGGTDQAEEETPAENEGQVVTQDEVVSQENTGLETDKASSEGGATSEVIEPADEGSNEKAGDFSTSDSGENTNNQIDEKDAIQDENNEENTQLKDSEQTENTESGVSENSAEKNSEETESSPADELFERLMGCKTYEELDAMMEAMTDEEYALMDEFTDEQNDALTALVDELSEYDAEVEVEKDDNNGSNNNGPADEGSFNHIEIEVTGTATFVVDGQTYTQTVTITTEDEFTVSAYTKQGGQQVAFTEFEYDGNKKGDGSIAGSTVELSGTYPTGTYGDPVYYVVTLVKDVTFTLNDGTTMTVPVTLSVTTYYWDKNNRCPGVYENDKTTPKTDWATNHKYLSGSGIDIDVSGETVGQAITEGKLAIQKKIYDDSNDTTPFTFTVQNSTNAYLIFEDNKYTGETSAALTDTCKVTVNGGSTVVLTEIPAGVYKITEIQEVGYIITDADGKAADNYTVDYIVEQKEDGSIPIAVFTNKKLNSEEAGISIKKTASGLPSSIPYPNPTVSIYAVDSNGDKNGNPVWTGVLTANGDTLYLTTTLPAGNYIIEENGHAVDGYNCNTTLTGGETVEGLNFTVLGGKRYDLTVNNDYREAPKTTSVTVSKTVSGNMGDQTKQFNFTAKIVETDGTTYVPTAYKGNVTTDGGFSFTLSHGNSVTLADVPIGSTLTIKETDATGYTVAVTANDKVITAGQDGEYTVQNIDANGVSVAFTNTLNVVPPTGIFSNAAPYLVMLLSGFMALLWFMIFRRRTV